MLVKEDDENAEMWYLLGFAHFQSRKYALANECVGIVKRLIEKQSLTDKILKVATEELREKILQELVARGGDVEQLLAQEREMEKKEEEDGGEMDEEQDELQDDEEDEEDSFETIEDEEKSAEGKQMSD